MNVCIIGCGGIGCEVAKLVIDAPQRYSSVTVIDMDTIDVTNINRQFLYSHEDVGRPKVHAMAAFLRTKAPQLQVSAYNESVINPRRFGPRFFASHDANFMCLDAFAPRKYVAEMCFLADVLLIDTGTSGLSGSVTGYPPSSMYPPGSPAVECYNCYNSDVRVTIPMCTLKNRPTKPEHCASYAIYIVQRMFNTDPCSELTEYAPLKVHASDAELSADIASFITCAFNAQLLDNEAVCTVVDTSMIEEVRSTVFGSSNADGNSICESARPSSPSLRAASTDMTQPAIKRTVAQPAPFYDMHRHLTVPETLHVVMASAFTLAKLIAAHEYAFSDYDRENPHLVALTAGIARLRMHCFGVEPVPTLFEISTLAGSIVPAVTFTNATVAALAMRLLREVHARRKSGLGSPVAIPLQYFVKNSTRFPLISDDLRPANPDCPVCSIRCYTLQARDESLLITSYITECLSKALSCRIISICGDNGILYEDSELSAWSTSEGAGDEIQSSSLQTQQPQQYHIHDDDVLRVSYQAADSDSTTRSAHVIVRLNANIDEYKLSLRSLSDAVDLV